LLYAGHVVGVLTGGTDTYSEYGSTASAWNWLSANACPTFEKEFPDANFCGDVMCPCVAAKGAARPMPNAAAGTRA
jgi:hypothetical protein